MLSSSDAKMKKASATPVVSAVTPKTQALRGGPAADEPLRCDPRCCRSSPTLAQEPRAILLHFGPPSDVGSPRPGAAGGGTGRPPLYSLAFSRGFGTLYTAVYSPRRRALELHWPGSRWPIALGDADEAALPVAYP